jgi:hypothetical protein
MYLVFILLLVIIVFYLCHKFQFESFDDHVNYETQERAGPMTDSDQYIKQVIDNQYPTIPSYFVPFSRFYVEIHEEPMFKKPITTLRDSTEQLSWVRTVKPIRSIRIRSVPNKNWRFLQFFSVGIFLENDRSKGIILKVPQDAQSIDYQIPDTNVKGENLEWMNTNESKIIYYTTNYYDPLLDLSL